MDLNIIESKKLGPEVWVISVVYYGKVYTTISFDEITAKIKMREILKKDRR